MKSQQFTALSLQKKNRRRALSPICYEGGGEGATVHRLRNELRSYDVLPVGQSVCSDNFPPKVLGGTRTKSNSYVALMRSEYGVCSL